VATIKELVEQYRQGAIGTGDVSDPKKANKSARRMITAYRVLRGTEEGRQALVSLLEDDEPSVRCNAAAHCLQWIPHVARHILEVLRDSQGPFSFDAEMTLKEYDKGRLKFDY
jgi:HEAT repeat protein